MPIFINKYTAIAKWIGAVLLLGLASYGGYTLYNINKINKRLSIEFIKSDAIIKNLNEKIADKEKERLDQAAIIKKKEIDYQKLVTGAAKIKNDLLAEKEANKLLRKAKAAEGAVGPILDSQTFADKTGQLRDKFFTDRNYKTVTVDNSGAITFQIEEAYALKQSVQDSEACINELANMKEQVLEGKKLIALDEQEIKLAAQKDAERDIREGIMKKQIVVLETSVHNEKFKKYLYMGLGILGGVAAHSAVHK